MPGSEPDDHHLARVVVELAKAMQQAKELGISVEEVQRQNDAIRDDSSSLA